MLAAPGSELPLFRRAIKPGIDNLFFVGLAQALPTLINFVEEQAKWLAELMAGNYVPPSLAEMQASIAYDEKRFMGHVIKTPRHTMQCDADLYEIEIRKKLRRGRKRRRPRPPPDHTALSPVRAATGCRRIVSQLRPSGS